MATWADKFKKAEQPTAEPSQSNGLLGGVANFFLGNTMALPGKVNDLTNKQVSRQPIQQGDYGEAAKRALSDTGDLLSASVPAGVELGSLVEAPGTIKSIVKGTPSLAEYLTKGGVGKKIGQAYEKATASGVTDSFGDFATEVKQALAQRVGNDPAYARVADQRLASEAPASIEASPQVSPSRYFDLKKQASNRLPNGFLSKFQGKSISNQVDEVIRDVAGKRAADLVPEVKNLNKLYKLYSNPLGSPAAIAGKAIAGGVVSQFLPKGLRDVIGL